MDLGTRALAGLTAAGASLPVVYNTGPMLAEDIYDVTGDPAVAADAGKQGVLNEKRALVGLALAGRRSALAAGRTFCAKAIDLLKPQLGRRWNQAWQAAGFSQFSLALPHNPHTMLLEFRAYFRTHPTHEVADKGVTAALADAGATAIQSANQAVDAAQADRADAAHARDAAMAQIRRRLIGLQNELGEFLADDDNRWLDFGFTRPVDSSTPDPVTGLTATAGLPGTLLVQWTPSARAVNYRVSWLVVNSGAEPTPAGLFADAAMVLQGMPSGANVAVRVSARNESGETSTTEVTAIVP
jgi:hypothetical protein